MPRKDDNLMEKEIIPKGVSVAFLAPDGGGKSTVIRELKRRWPGHFTNFSYFHFRPEWLKNLSQVHKKMPARIPWEEKDPGTSPPVEAPHEGKLQSKPKSFLRFMYYNIDFIFGTFFLVNKLKKQGHLVVFDRYYYDYFADLVRYKYDLSLGLIRLLCPLIPRPDIVFILDADTEVIYNRKREMPWEEVERQRKAYLSLLDKDLHAVRIEVDRDVETIVSEVMDMILTWQKRS